MFLFGKDIVLLRTDSVSMKSSEFVKRNYNRIKNTIEHLLISLKRTGSGFKSLNEDIKVVAGGISDGKIKYSKVKPWEKAQ